MLETFEEAYPSWERANSFERWGLVTEAETARASYQSLIIRLLLTQACADPDRPATSNPSAGQPS